MNLDYIDHEIGPDEDPNDCTLTYREVGEHLGIGRARVFDHEQQALKSIRRALEQRGVASAFCVVVSARNAEGLKL